MTTAGKSAAVKERSHSDTDPAVELDEIYAEDASAGADAEASPADPDLADEQAPPEDKGGVRRRVRLLAYGVLPALVLLLTVGTGYLKWFDGSTHAAQLAAVDARQAAIDGTIAMLSYRPDTVDRDLGAAGDRLTSGFKDSYAKLVHDVVIPGSKQQQITALATVPAAATVSASANHAVVLVFVDQTITIGHDTPSNTASRVRVTLDNVGGRWLIAGFDPI
jgi:Mce-associated membrane protein